MVYLAAASFRMQVLGVPFRVALIAISAVVAQDTR
jgi:hypothetical protein